MPTGETRLDESYLETLKTILIDQEVLLTTYTD